MKLESDWTQLLPKLLWEIACRFGSIEDLFEFRGVCKAWRSATASGTSVKFLKPSRVPLLMLAQKENSDEREFYSPYKRRILMTLTLPELKDKRIIEVKFGWLLTLTEDSGEVTLFNPATRAQIHVPNYTTYPDYENHITNPRFTFISRAVLSNNPSDDPLNFVLYVLPLHGVGCWRAGDKNWTELPRNRYDTEDIEYYNNKLYMAHQEEDGKATVTILDVHNHNSKVNLKITYNFYNFQKYDSFIRYLVETSRGSLLLITRYYVADLLDYETNDFVVIMADVMKGEWTVTDNLEDDVIFIGGNGAISIPAANFPHQDTIKPNCIYFTDDFCDLFYGRLDWGGIGGRDMGIFDMKDKAIERFNIDSSSNICGPIWIDSSIIMS